MNDYLVKLFNRDDFTESRKNHPSCQNYRKLNRATVGLEYL